MVTRANDEALGGGEYHYLLNEAHNGYLETYLNTGLLGVFLLLGVLGSAAHRIKKQVLAGDPCGPLRLAFLASIVFYGMSEAIFNRLSFLWLVILLSLLSLPALSVGSQTGFGPAVDPSRESLSPGRPFVEA